MSWVYSGLTLLLVIMDSDSAFSLQSSDLSLPPKIIKPMSNFLWDRTDGQKDRHWPQIKSNCNGRRDKKN